MRIMKENMLKKHKAKGIAIMLSSAVLTCTGQLSWKLASANSSLLFVLLGFCLYGGGALLMILALRYGELSVLHPMLSAGYVLSLILGALVLHEHISLLQILGVAAIILGLVFINVPKGSKRG